ncbi:FGGY family carbohydrate kinase [Lichenihabitans sp. Uapishka_5]|uniref:FGGY-family carbohydrate kinase n=1 Tax=Lichenihabitans sp. Uapishka_5 TaxID=3037302 RepID=UPI0029E82A00|nr:FGGY family carbohydrate kinase [Lichenihabitans sp. Uapishka_5]MDX7952896.1 FGGY family carbohydrate kinase [Lichenihabitans sp. Uapishka_5]
MNTIAVFDVGKTNVKLMAVAPDGFILETVSAANPVQPGPPYRHHDLGRLEAWLIDNLAALAHRHPIDAIVTTGHGSGGVLVGDDGPLMPMIDYEQAPPPAVDAEYRRIAGAFRERGSAIMIGTAHLARQMLWLERDWPEVFAGARAFLAHPQYWAWRLSGVLASEVTSLAAQSHLWCSAEARPAALVAARGWDRLMAPLRPAWATLGSLKPAFVRSTGLPATTRVLNGIHDSSANLYRYQAAGLSDMTVVSTGTWIVPISDQPGPDFEHEQPGLCCNADVFGHPLPGMLVMGGREFSAVAGDAAGPASPALMHRLIDTGTMALPSFSGDDCLFPGTARHGVVAGELAGDAAARFTLAVLYTALLTDCCLDTVGTTTVVLDGSFVRDPLYGALIAALRPDRRVLVNHDQFGTVAGAALLATHEQRGGPVPLALETPTRFDHPGLMAYAKTWRDQAHARKTP